jgi:hypothetical protein
MTRTWDSEPSAMSDGGADAADRVSPAVNPARAWGVRGFQPNSKPESESESGRTRPAVRSRMENVLCGRDQARERRPLALGANARKVYYWGALAGKRRGLRFDPELLYAGAMFHDMGLTDQHSSADERFEVDGANAARDFLRANAQKYSSAIAGLPKWSGKAPRTREEWERAEPKGVSNYERTRTR